jgi:hypothetical protein
MGGNGTPAPAGIGGKLRAGRLKGGGPFPREDGPIWRILRPGAARFRLGPLIYYPVVVCSWRGELVKERTIKCQNCGHRSAVEAVLCEECRMPLRPSRRENAASARETNCMILLVGVGLITGATIFMAPPAPMGGVIGMAMSLALIGLPALVPLLCYVLYALLHMAAPAPRLVVILPALLCAAGTVVAACRFNPAELLPLGDKFAPLVVYGGIAAINALVVWLLWVVTRPELD